MQALTVRRLTETMKFSPRFSCLIKVYDDKTFIDGTGKSDDGKDGMLVKPYLAESAVVKKSDGSKKLLQ